MKLPLFLIKKPTPKKKLRASTARRSMAAPDEMDYEEMSEPNMKLSRALLIVLVLHVVAVAGIIAFNTIKSRQGVLPATAETVAAPSPDNAPSVAAKMDAATTAPAAAPAGTTAITPIAQTKPAGTEMVRKAEPIKATPSAPSVSDSGKFYIVAKGDNPVKIAKKLKVSESDLLTVNHIDDPRKLQIGQKLIVPASKRSKNKKSDD
ncbi:hypothetical protein BH18VER1_BH18VER1_03770 [soil metagenome]